MHGVGGFSFQIYNFIFDFKKISHLIVLTTKNKVPHIIYTVNKISFNSMENNKPKVHIGSTIQYNMKQVEV